jgi:hypothetical protein
MPTGEHAPTIPAPPPCQRGPDVRQVGGLLSRSGYFGTEHHGWACSQAIGDTLEMAIGPGLNLVQL